MTFLQRILGRAREPAAPAPEQRRSSFFSAGSGVVASGLPHPALAENLATIVACINAIASGLASLPALVYRREDRGRSEAPNHPVARLIRAPNEFQTWPDWVEMTMSQVLLFGNAISWIDFDGAGRPVRLVPIPFGNVMLSWLPGPRRLAYDVRPSSYAFGGAAVPPGRYFSDEIFHLKDRSDDGIIGRSRLSRAPEPLEGAMNLATFASSLWRNAASPSGFLRHPGTLSREAKEYISASFSENFAGPLNARKIPILEENMEWQSASATPEDAEVLSSRRFAVQELCRLMAIPPPIVQDYSNNTFTNAQQADQWFARHSLMPWAKKIEAEFSRSVFGDGSEFHLEIDFSAMVRGSYTERWQTAIAAVQAGILTRDEVREQEGFAPLGEAGEPAPGSEAEP